MVGLARRSPTAALSVRFRMLIRGLCKPTGSPNRHGCQEYCDTVTIAIAGVFELTRDGFNLQT